MREQIIGIRVVRAFVREPEETERFDGVERTTLTDTSLKAGRLMALMFPLVMLVVNASSVGVDLVRRQPHRERRHDRSAPWSPSSATSP